MAAPKEWNSDFAGIQISMDVEGDKFFKATDEALCELLSKPIGADLLDLLKKRCAGIGSKTKGGHVLINLARSTIGGKPDREEAILGKTAQQAAQWDEETRSIKLFKGNKLVVSGGGSSGVVCYSPWAAKIYKEAIGIETPAFIALGHELIHALHSLSGDVPGDIKGKAANGMPKWLINEEARTVGAGKYKDARISENTLRKEHGIPLRTFYIEAGDCDAKNL